MEPNSTPLVVKIASLPVLAILLLGACNASPYQEGPTLGENPDLLGPNITEEIRAGEFFIGPSDKIQLSVWGHSDLSRVYEVGQDGEAYFHLVGPLNVVGLNRGQLRNRLVEEYDRFLVDPSIDVTIEMSARRKITILGSVTKRGVFPMQHPKVTVLDAIADAGGVAEDGDATGVLIARRIQGQVVVKPYNLDLMWAPSDPRIRTEIPYVQPGDYLYVVRSAREDFDDWMATITGVLRNTLLAERIITGAGRLDIALSGN